MCFFFNSQEPNILRVSTLQTPKECSLTVYNRWLTETKKLNLKSTELIKDRRLFATKFGEINESLQLRAKVFFLFFCATLET